MGLCCWIESLQSLSLSSQVGLALVCALAGFYFFQKRKDAAKLEGLKREWAAAGQDVVVLHMFSRARVCPNPSPFPLKLETWMRIHGVNYVPEFEVRMSFENQLKNK